MRRSSLQVTLRSILAVGGVLVVSGCSVLGSQDVEEAPYRVLREDGAFELRAYDEFIVARTRVDAGFDEAGDIAFGRLFGYISGDNEGEREIATTAPVVAEPADGRTDTGGTEIAMTAPVLAEGAGNSWSYAFVLPAGFTLETAPRPTDPDVEIAVVPSRTVAVIRYSGWSSEERYREHEQKLLSWIEAEDLIATSPPRSAGYDPPWTLPPLRRNEVLVDVEPTPSGP